MQSKITPFLMFVGQAEEAMTFYRSVFPDSELLDIRRYAAGEAGAEGTVMQARFVLKGQHFLCIDSPAVHDFTFTPSLSLFVECGDEAEIDAAFEMLSDGGKVLMPLDAYPFSRKFGWLDDRYGVSWQLSLPHG